MRNFQESSDRSENLKFLLFAPKDPFGELFSKIILKSSTEFLFWQKLGKFEIGLEVPNGPIEIMQISAFSNGSCKATETCLQFIFSQFVAHLLKFVLKYILCRPEHLFLLSLFCKDYNVCHSLDRDFYHI